MSPWNRNEHLKLATELCCWSRTARHLEEIDTNVDIKATIFKRSELGSTSFKDFFNTKQQCSELELITTEPPDEATASNWTDNWKLFAERLKLSHVIMEMNEIKSHSFQPLVIKPHLVPYLSLIISESFVISVNQHLPPNQWIPLETFLRFHHSHIDYDSQVLQFFTTSIVELYSQLSNLSIYCDLSINGFLCDNACWLLFDPIKAHFSTYKKKPLEYYTNLWATEKLTNYEYLQVLNEYAGRQRGDVHNHPIFPWVCDFTEKEGGWRNLSRTKFRLNKGDDQIKEMYKRAPQHHISELLSDIGYMVYRARVEPVEKLCQHVRAKWVPLEYPVSVMRMYEWTPDECIPEFYDDPTIFRSIHKDMPSLTLPSFAQTPEEFIKWHREMLESDQVSESLHKWIDLTFGYLLTGDEAVKAWNVHLSLVETRTRRLRGHGVVQLFSRPHPQRCTNIPKDSFLFERELRLLELSTGKGETKTNGKENEPEGNPVSLSKLYGELKKKISKSRKRRIGQMKSVVLLISTIGLAPQACGQYLTDVIERLLQQESYFLPPVYRTLFLSLLEENANFPSSTEFSMFLITKLAIKTMTIWGHNRLASFYSYHLLRSSILMDNCEKRIQSCLVKELDAFCQFVEHSTLFEFIAVPIFERLLLMPESAITSVHRLFPILCRYLDDESLEQLVPSLTSLLSCESSIKLLDRRYLLQVSIVYGAPAFLERFLPAIVEAAAARQTDRSIVAKDSLLWLSKRYGPVVCAKFISANLLRILSSCYDGLLMVGADQQPKTVFELLLVGDERGSRVEQALAEIVASYSVTFVTVQYLPFAVDYVEQCFKRLTESMEAGLVAILRIVSISVDSMTDHLLMNYLEDYVINQILTKIISQCLLSNAPFTSDRNRIIVLSRAIVLLHRVAVRIGVENTRTSAKEPLEMLLNVFADQFEADEFLNISQRTTADSKNFKVPLWLAEAMIEKFANAWGVPLLSTLCKDPAFIVPFVSSKVRSQPTDFSPVNPIAAYNFGGRLPSGNRLYSLSSASPSPSTIGGVGTCDSGSLSAIWCARVSAAACSNTSRSSFRFDHLSLCSFEGHSGAIKCVQALSNENSFLSGSADKTVKLWSMRPEQDKVEAQWTYRSHTKQIQDILALSTNAIASTDGSVHIWDPFRGYTLTTLDWQDGNICALSKMDRNTIAAISSLHSTVRIIDLRTGQWTSELKIGLTGLARAIAVRESGARMAVVLSNGALVVADGRTGKLSSVSHGNNNHPTSIQWMASNKLFVSDADEPAVIFSTTPRIISQKSLNDVVINSHVSDNLLTTVQMSNTIKVYNEKETVVLEARLKNDLLPGIATVVRHLPLNNAYLIGSNQGGLKLLC